jgi:hypothetical protein
MSAASCQEGEAGACAANRCVDVSGVPLAACCTIAVCACVQLVQSTQTGGQLVSSVSSAQGSGQTDANAIPLSSCRAISARSVIETLRRIVGRGLYHMPGRELMLRSELTGHERQSLARAFLPDAI